MTLTKKPSVNTVGKGENAGNQCFVLFPQCFETHQRVPSSEPHLNSHLQMLCI